MSFELIPGEPPGEGLLRALTEQLRAAAAGLGRAAAESADRGAGAAQVHPDEAVVHEARKSFKRARATLRLLRGAFEDEAIPQSLLRRFRDLGRQLAATRDVQMMGEAFDKLLQGAATPPSPATVAVVQQALQAHRAGLGGALLVEDLQAVVASLDGAGQVLATWQLGPLVWKSVRRGLRKIYQQGRRTFQRAAAKSKAVRMHEWRKRVKDLYYVLTLLRPARPRRLGKLTAQLDRLAEHLGDAHDLDVLEAALQKDSTCAGASVAEVLPLLRDRRRELQRTALPIGAALYKKYPRRFVRQLADRLEAWSPLPSPAPSGTQT